MTQLSGAGAFYSVASTLVTEVEDELTGSLGGAVGRACVVPGDIVEDDCCGALAVSVQRFFLTETFPVQAASTGETQPGPCEMPWIVGEVRLQVTRCAPLPISPAIAPTCEALDACARVLLDDQFHLLHRVAEVLCEMKQNDQIIDYAVVSDEAVGPDADCVGIQLVVHVCLER